MVQRKLEMIEMGQFNWALLHCGVMALPDEEIMNPIVEVNCLKFVLTAN